MSDNELLRPHDPFSGHAAPEEPVTAVTEEVTRELEPAKDETPAPVPEKKAPPKRRAPRRRRASRADADAAAGRVAK